MRRKEKIEISSNIRNLTGLSVRKAGYAAPLFVTIFFVKK